MESYLSIIKEEKRLTKDQMVKLKAILHQVLSNISIYIVKQNQKIIVCKHQTLHKELSLKRRTHMKSQTLQLHLDRSILEETLLKWVSKVVKAANNSKSKSSRFIANQQKDFR